MIAVNHRVCAKILPADKAAGNMCPIASIKSTGCYCPYELKLIILFALFELGIVEVGVHPIQVKQLGMGAAFHHLAAVNHQYLVGCQDGAQDGGR